MAEVEHVKRGGAGQHVVADERHSGPRCIWPLFWLGFVNGTHAVLGEWLGIHATMYQKKRIMQRFNRHMVAKAADERSLPHRAQRTPNNNERLEGSTYPWRKPRPQILKNAKNIFISFMVIFP